MRIAVAVDGSENALRAAKHALFLAQYLPNAHIELITVADFNKAKNERLLAQSPESVQLLRDKKLRPILEYAESVGVEVSTHVLKGSPSEQILAYLDNESIDQLVIGSRGLNTFQEMVLGSVSHKVMKHAPCPVTIVK